jgi:hypothetical protein
VFRWRQTFARPSVGLSSDQWTRLHVRIVHWVRQQPFSTAGALRGNLAFGGHISTRTVIRHLHHQGMRARRPIKRPQLTLRHRHARFDWFVVHEHWLVSQRMIVEMGDYAWSEHIVTVFLACQITIKNAQVQLTEFHGLRCRQT